MWRMVVDARSFRPVASGPTSPLNGDDVGAITSLYADGHRRSEDPHCFDPSMVEQGIFRGVWEDEELVAVAGAHRVVPSEGACAVGNVYTRHDQRGRGFGARVTSAVVSAALARGIPTAVLNVDQRNASAIRVYEGLGFRLHCDFVEGPAFRS
jgi:predicted GNAT family acetyltransferase